MRSAALVTSLLLLAGGCVGGDDDCLYGGNQAADPIPPLRDPSTGVCQVQQRAGGNCLRPATGAEEDQAPPEEPGPSTEDWSFCSTECSGLAEETCKSTAGCQPAYVDHCAECETPALNYYDCFAVAPSGPVNGEDCAGLDAAECSRHDDCRLVYDTDFSCAASDAAAGAEAPQFCQPGPVAFLECAGEDAPLIP